MSTDVLADLRTRIRKSPDTCYKIARRSGVPDCTLSRFLRGQPIRVATAARIAEALGQRLTLEEAI